MSKNLSKYFGILFEKDTFYGIPFDEYTWEPEEYGMEQDRFAVWIYKKNGKLHDNSESTPTFSEAKKLAKEMTSQRPDLNKGLSIKIWDLKTKKVLATYKW